LRVARRVLVRLQRQRRRRPRLMALRAVLGEEGSDVAVIREAARPRPILGDRNAAPVDWRLGGGDGPPRQDILNRLLQLAPAGAAQRSAQSNLIADSSAIAKPATGVD